MESSYSLNGTVYNAYTLKPAKAITAVEAAELCGVSLRTFRKWLKKGHNLRYVTNADGEKMYLDYEVQDWVKNCVRQKKRPRTWKRGISLLKERVLINRQEVIGKLENILSKEWTSVQRKINKFDDSHVDAYRRGVSDALRIVKNQYIECWDYHPHIGDRVWVGGCVGKIKKIENDVVTVNGTYHYYNEDDDNSPGYAESWSFKYELNSDISNQIKPFYHLKTPIKDSEREIVWDYEPIEPMARF